MSASVWLCNDSGDAHERFVVGQTVFGAGRGLRPSTAYDFALSSGGNRGKAELVARYTTDRHGTLATAVLLPYVDLLHHDRSGLRTLREALACHVERTSTIRIRRQGTRKAEHTALTFMVARPGPEPRLFSCDPEGRPQTGIEQGEGLIAIALHQFPAGCIRIFIVYRQFGWRLGDPIEPARTHGAVAVRTLHHDGSSLRIITLASAAELHAGSYQFIARAFPLGWYAADEPGLLADDVLWDRRLASLVVRKPFATHFGFDNGVVLAPEIAGRPMAHRPYFRFVNNFPKGTDVYAALDPDALPPGLLSRRAAIYVIRHKTAAQWAASNALDDVSGPGMTAVPKIVPIVPGCINWNETLVWPNPQTPPEPSRRPAHPYLASGTQQHDAR